MNHSVDAQVPAAVNAAVAAVDSVRKVPAGSVTISAARPAVSSRKMPAHSQEPQLAGGEHDRGLQREHQRGDDQQARHRSGHDLADGRREPDGRQPRDQARVAAIQPGGERIGSHGQPDGFGQAPARRHEQPQRPGDFQVPCRADAPCRGSALRSSGPRFPCVAAHWLQAAQRQDDQHDYHDENDCSDADIHGFPL